MRLGLLLLLAACHDGRTPPEKEGRERLGGSGCSSDAECEANERCLQNLCIPLPVDDGGGGPTQNLHLSATPLSLSFGQVAVGETRRLAVVVTNDGEGVVTLSDARIEPADAPFHIEQLGAGPFWIRPERGREVFVSYTPVEAGAHSASLALTSEAPTVAVQLSGN